MEGNSPLERHPYLVIKETIQALENKEKGLDQALKSLNDEFFSGRSPYEQGVGYNKFQKERDRLNKELNDIRSKIKDLNEAKLIWEKKMIKEN